MLLKKRGYLKNSVSFNEKKVYVPKYVVRKYDSIPNDIINMEREVWSYNSDPDILDIPVKNVITIENDEYILGYIIISERYFKYGNLNMECDILCDDIKRAIDIEDLVILNRRLAAPYLREFSDNIFNTIKSSNVDMIVLNCNDFSRSLLKRLSSLELEIKSYNYPAFSPTGYLNMNDEYKLITTAERLTLMNMITNLYNEFKIEEFDNILKLVEGGALYSPISELIRIIESNNIINDSLDLNEREIYLKLKSEF